MIFKLSILRRGFAPRAAWVGAAALAVGFLAGGSAAQAASPPANTIIGNQASATYLDQNGVSQSATSNLVQTTVLQVGSYTLDGNASTATPPATINAKVGAAGATLYAPHVLTNTGNGADTFTISVPTPSASFSKVEVYADANGDGLPDSTTPLCSVTPTTTCSFTTPNVAGNNGTFPFVVAYTLPSTATGSTAITQTVNAVPTSTALYSTTSITTQDTYTYTRSGTPDRIAFTWGGISHTNLNFGDVDNSTLVSSEAKSGLPGSTVSYAHTFTAGSAGSVAFSIASQTATPSASGWSAVIYADPGCTGTLPAGATPLSTGTAVNFAGTVCVIVQQFIPATAPLGSSNTAVLQAVFSYTGADPALSSTYQVQDITTVSNSALDLKKEVRNVTQGGSFGLNNNAKSGETLEYRITYTNNGSVPLNSLTVNDATPAYSSFVSATTGTTPATLTSCNKHTPANAAPAAAVACTTTQTAGGSGAIEWKFIGTLAPGGTGTVLFQVKVN